MLPATQTRFRDLLSTRLPADAEYRFINPADEEGIRIEWGGGDNAVCLIISRFDLTDFESEARANRTGVERRLATLLDGKLATFEPSHEVQIWKLTDCTTGM